MRRRGASSPIVQPAQRDAPLLAGLTAQAKAQRQKVQIARKQLGMTEDDYRAMLLRITGQTSSTRCGTRQLDEVLAEFLRLGWKGAAPRAGRKPLPADPQIRKIFAIWNDIGRLIEHGGPKGLREFVSRQTKSEATPDGISAPEFLDSVQANKVLEGLKAWRARLIRPKAAR